ncbi:SAF domain-containing protein [Angustibacter sp. McL0619]|uniref:SAF domain-containing protein n=1 Tax=Angustibacter sp. McL0619 TaxID=3415676 RepID=UPI003CF0FD8D
MSTSTMPDARTGAAQALHERAAHRLRPPSWREPRLLLGVLLVLMSVVAGGWVVRSADHTVPVYAARHTLTPGDALTTDDLTVVRVRLGSGAGAYLAAAAGSTPPAGAVVLRAVPAGELVARSAVGDRAQVDLRPVAVSIEPEVAERLAPGVMVDVWVAARRGDRSDAFEPPHLAAAGVQVSATSTQHGALGSSTSSAVHLLLGPDLVPDLIEAVDNQARITLVPVPGTLPERRS